MPTAANHHIGPDTARGAVPRGWDENPTAWPKRLRVAALAVLGACVAAYLTLYQVGVLANAWDPVFGSASTRDVLDLTSPFPDAALGVVAYAAEVALCFVGGPARWRTLPWAPLAFGVVIAAGAVTSVGLIAVQAIVVGSWCALCLVSAGLSFVIFALGVAEPLAALQHLAAVRQAGEPVRRELLGRRAHG